MYAYTAEDRAIVHARVDEFRDQLRRFRAGLLDDKEFLALRLRNGLYKQRHAFMLRVAIPYGLLTSDQTRALAHIATRYDKGFGHFTTRQNIQYNWPELDDVPDILAHLATVDMHAIQTSGNCVRNITVDHLAGVARDEDVDPRPYAEIVRLHTTLHPEFNYLPRKFKIAFTGATNDRAAVLFHDIGIVTKRNTSGDVRLRVIVGGGLGRTPVIGSVVREDLEPEHLLSYVDAILRVYNTGGDRQNKFKARIKIQLRTLGLEKFTALVDEEHARIKDGPLKVSREEIERFIAAYAPPAYATDVPEQEIAPDDGLYRAWRAQNVSAHKVAGHSVVTLPLKGLGRVPGDATDRELLALADLADRFNKSEVRTTHEQNLVFAHVETRDLPALYAALKPLGFAEPIHGLLPDLICCPGLDFCDLANASSIPIAKAVAERVSSSEKLLQIGEVKLKMSGCINACGHHHVGHIGILGIDKKGEEAYQIMLGGDATFDAALGKWLGPALDKLAVVDAVDKVCDAYVEMRHTGERFIDTVKRTGLKPFHDAVYGASTTTDEGAAS
jgi:sulfite reductase (NADPH) hemoprotein beta-component